MKTSQAKKEYNKKWAKEHYDYWIEYHRKYRERNSERIKKANKEWRKKNPNWYQEYIKKFPRDEYMVEYSRKYRKTSAYKKQYKKRIDRQRLIGAVRAVSAVAHAILMNRLPSLKKKYVLCVDCRKNRATQYDHRDYNKPLMVEPVCGSCNLKRGSAISLERGVLCTK